MDTLLAAVQGVLEQCDGRSFISTNGPEIAALRVAAPPEIQQAAEATIAAQRVTVAADAPPADAPKAEDAAAYVSPFDRKEPVAGADAAAPETSGAAETISAGEIDVVGPAKMDAANAQAIEEGQQP